MHELKERFKQTRLSSELIKEGLAKRSRVSLGSIKQFKNSGEISLKSLLKLALILECLENFSQIPLVKSPIDEVIKNSTHVSTPKRGKIK